MDAVLVHLYARWFVLDVGEPDARNVSVRHWFAIAHRHSLLPHDVCVLGDHHRRILHSPIRRARSSTFRVQRRSDVVAARESGSMDAHAARRHALRFVCRSRGAVPHGHHADDEVRSIHKGGKEAGSGTRLQASQAAQVGQAIIRFHVHRNRHRRVAAQLLGRSVLAG